MLQVQQNGEQNPALQVISLDRNQSQYDDLSRTPFVISYLACHQYRPKKDSKHKSIVLEMDMIHDDESRMKKERRGNHTSSQSVDILTGDSIHGVKCMKNRRGRQDTNLSRAAPKTNSVRITVDR